MGKKGPINTYCLYCEAAREMKVSDELDRMGYKPFVPFEEKYVSVNGILSVKKERLLPRYVFFDIPAGAEPPWEMIKQLPYVQKILQYSDEERALRKEDLAFVEWLKRYDGLLRISPVIRVGTKIQVVGGPLKDFEGEIVDVKKSRRCVAINISETGHFQKIWCPIEYIEEI